MAAILRRAAEPRILLALLSLLAIPDRGSRALAQGHGGGAGHLAAGPGYGHYGRYGGYGGYGRYGYGGFGWGIGYGLGLGLGFYGYPYYGYPYGDPYYPAPYGYYPGPPYVAGSAPANPDLPVIPQAPIAGVTVRASGGVISPTPGAGPDSEVVLVLRTPESAVVWINGVRTTQAGARREFISTGLAPGRSYTFEITVKWAGPDGKAMAAAKKLSVQAGERRVIDLGPTSPDVTPIDFSGKK